MTTKCKTDPDAQAKAELLGPATRQLAALIRRDVETGHEPFAQEYGHERHSLSEAEAEVFQLSFDEMPSLVAV